MYICATVVCIIYTCRIHDPRNYFMKTRPKENSSFHQSDPERWFFVVVEMVKTQGWLC